MAAVGALLLFLGARYPTLAPVGMAAGWVILMTPAVVDRWRAPLTAFMVGLWVAMFPLWAPLMKYGWLAYVVIVIASGVHLAVQPLAAAWLHRAARLPAFVVIPLSVGAAEWTRPLIGFSNWNMFQLGNSLHTAPVLLQAADLIGVLGLSVIWSVPWAWSIDLARWLASGRPRSGRRIVVQGAAVAGTLVTLLFGYGVVRLSDDRTVEGPTLAVVQPNERHGHSRTPEVVRRQEQLTLERVGPDADLIVWPENAILDLYEESPRYHQVVERIVRRLDTPLLFGAQGRGSEPGRFTNSSLLVDRDGRVVGRNDKIVLYPFSERRAFRPVEAVVPPFKRAMTRLTEAAWGEAPNGEEGQHPVPMTLTTADGSWTFWTPICYEICYADIARDAARRGARFFVNITSEGWLGWGLNNNQMAVSIARAVENRVGVVRVGNTGISCFIRPDGRVERYLRGDGGRMLLDAGVLEHAVRVDPRAPTLYSRIGGGIDLLWPLGWLGLLAYSVIRRARS